MTTRQECLNPPHKLLASARFGFINRSFLQIKYVGLFGAVACRRQAQLAGYDDVLFVDDDKLVSEDATWNIRFCEGDTVFWPEGKILHGVTMHLLMQAHPDFTTPPIRLSDLVSFDAAFATDTTVDVRPVAAIDALNYWTGGSALKSLRERYADVPLDRL